MQPKYKRVLIKLSGEAIYGIDNAEYNTLPDGTKELKSIPIIDRKKLDAICEKLKECHDMGVEIAIVVGGGNIWRGGQYGEGFDRARADHMGMLATAINALAISETLEKMGCETRVMTAVEMNQFAEPYIRGKAISHLKKGRIVIFGCGTGISHMTTDTTSVVRAVEIGADVVMLAKNVDAVYTADPKKDPNAKKILNMDYMEIIKNRLKVIDTTATSFSMDNSLPILLFALEEPENIVRAICGEQVGTVVSSK